MINYGFLKIVDLSINNAEIKIKEELGKEGFNIITRIDMKEKFREKLNVDFHNYLILGACSPKNAYKAINAEENIGLFLPCNIIVYDKEGKTVVSVVKPTIAMNMIENTELKEYALEIENKLKRVLDNI